MVVIMCVIVVMIILVIAGVIMIRMIIVLRMLLAIVIMFVVIIVRVLVMLLLVVPVVFMRMIVVIIVAMVVMIIVPMIFVVIVVVVVIGREYDRITEVVCHRPFLLNQFERDRIRRQCLARLFEPRRQTLANPNQQLGVLKRPGFRRAECVTVGRCAIFEKNVRRSHSLHDHGDQGLHRRDVCNHPWGICESRRRRNECNDG